MAGICVLYKNLDKFEFYLDGKKYEATQCLAKKYMKDELPGYHSLTSVIKQAKIIKDIQENCDSWNDSLKGKNSQTPS